MSGERIALDVHAHLAPIVAESLAGIDGVAWSAATRTLSVDGHDVGMKALFTPAALLEWMAAHDVAETWISAPPPLYRQHLRGADARRWADYVNDGLTEIAESSGGRLRALRHLPTQDPDVAVAVAEAAIASGHALFAMPAGTGDERVLSDAAFEGLWSVLNGARAFVFVHPGECADGRLAGFYLGNLLGNPYETTVAIAHLAFGGVLDRYHDFTLCFAHGGGAAGALAGRFSRGFDTARPGVNAKGQSPGAALRSICVDCIVHDEAALVLAERWIGAEKILFGSDWPFPMGLPDPRAQFEGFDAARRARVFSDNPEALLRSLGARTLTCEATDG